VNLEANALSGGILFRAEKNELSKQKKIGNTEESYYGQMTTKNLFHCLMINQSLQEVLQNRNRFRDWIAVTSSLPILKSN
jgi:hypothetical protein